MGWHFCAVNFFFCSALNARFSIWSFFLDFARIDLSVWTWELHYSKMISIISWWKCCQDIFIMWLRARFAMQLMKIVFSCFSIWLQLHTSSYSFFFSFFQVDMFSFVHLCVYCCMCTECLYIFAFRTHVLVRKCVPHPSVRMCASVHACEPVWVRMREKLCVPVQMLSNMWTASAIEWTRACICACAYMIVSECFSVLGACVQARLLCMCTYVSTASCVSRCNE